MVNFKQWVCEFSGCDGGDIGTKKDPSIWLCGIEWGEGFKNIDSFNHHLAKNNTMLPPTGFEKWEENIAYPFNWQAMKLLSAIHGGKVEDYKNFAQNTKPFIFGEKGFFKMNLYPVAFKNTNHSYWKQEYKNVTGLQTKNEYIEFCKQNRFPIINSWVKKYNPKLIICLGISYITDFKNAFCHENTIFNEETIDNKKLFWADNNGSLIVVIPFLLNPYGLNKNTTIQKFGGKISEIMNKINFIHTK